MTRPAIHRVWAPLAAVAILTGCGGGSSSDRVQAPPAAAFCEPSDAAVVQDFDPAALPLPGIEAERKAVLQRIRNSIFGGSAINAALQQTTISGEEPPVFALELDDRALMVWRIKETDLAEFSELVGLESPLTLTRTALPGAATGDGDDRGRHYYLLADISTANRAENGAMIEWKTFVSSASDATPRLYRFSKAVARAGLDLLEIRNDTASDLTIAKSGDSLVAVLNDPADSLSVSIPLGGPEVADTLNLTREFLTAGEQTLGSAGFLSNYYYDGSSVSAPFQAIPVANVSVTGNLPWFRHVEQLEQILVASQPTQYLVQPRNEVIQTNAEAQCLADASSAGSSSELFACLTNAILTGKAPAAVYAELHAAAANLGLTLTATATLHYAVADLYQGLTIFAGAEKPKLFFALKPEPKAIFINFEIPEDRVADFKRDFLPTGFELAKVRFYPEQCDPVYAVSLNVYEAVGQNLDSFRAEWSTYVINPLEADPRPRFSVLEAQSTAGGFDPIIAMEQYRDWQQRNPGKAFNFLDPDSLFDLIEEPNPDFNYTVDSSIRIQLTNMAEDILVDVDIAYPGEDRILTTRPLAGWMEANDFVYWEEVADILKYDSNVMFAELLVFEALPDDLILDNSFEGYVAPEPLPIILWNGPQHIALEPWGNLDDLPIEAGD